MSQQQGMAAAPPPAGARTRSPVRAEQTTTPDYLQQRVAFPARPAGPGQASVITPAGAKGVGGRLTQVSTPRLLVTLMALAVAVVLLFGAVTTSSLIGSAGATGRAAHNAEQLVRVQNIEAQLLRADALATNAFLVGGLESQESRAEYDAAVDDAARLLVEASEAQPADADALRVVASELVVYTDAMAQARANNRQGYPIGASFLNQASARLRQTTVPALEAMAEANTQRVAAETGNLALVAVGLVLLLALGVLAVTMRVLAVRFRRTINLGLAVATALVLVGGLLAVAVLANVARTVDNLQDGALNGIQQLSAARTSGYDAKALESLTLVSRGSGGAYEESWVQRSDGVLTALDAAGEPELVTAWESYRAVHQQIRELDDGGNWDGAVAAATGEEADQSNAAATAFQDALGPALNADVVSAEQTLGGLGISLWIAAVVTVLATLGATAAAAVGIQTRRREYE